MTDQGKRISPPASTTVAVDNVAPRQVTLSAAGRTSITAGGSVSVRGTFSDPGAADTWSYVIDWGDGTAPTAGTTASQQTGIAASHTYAQAGAFAVTRTVTDDDAGSASAAPLSVSVSPRKR